MDVLALIKCPECNKEVSDKAVSCPNCGFPISSTQNSVEAPMKKYCVSTKKYVTKDLLDQISKSMTSKNIVFQSQTDVLVNDIGYNDALAIKNKLQYYNIRAEVKEAIIDIVLCPRCNSSQIGVVNRGHNAILGWWGSGDPQNVCQKCGYKWTPGKKW